jgi:hypothetical protein
MQFENNESINSLKSARIVMDSLVDELGPDYDLTTAMIAFYEPEQLTELCEETVAMSEMRLDWVNFNKNHHIEYLRHLEHNGYVPSLEQRKKIYETYKLFSMIDENFDSSEDLTIHEMERRVIGKIYDEEQKDCDYFISQAEKIETQKKKYSKILRWAATAFCSASVSFVGLGVARTIDKNANFTEGQKEAYELSIILAGAAVGARAGARLKGMLFFQRCSDEYSHIKAQQVISSKIRKRINNGSQVD